MQVLWEMFGFGMGASFLLPFLAAFRISDPRRSAEVAVLVTAALLVVYAWLPYSEPRVPRWYFLASIVLFGCVVSVFLYITKRFLVRAGTEAQVGHAKRWRSAK